ncbi:hypothetical protein ANN_16878 [Periplaneta americana]|uniref:Uncharacterized protein n=1 Tax=Periplaneta americana TaxID=6978 RepID=A0ABQ8SSK7_PERAM|nr:hypothetical protein ANN_16878 [Periplaneta americana]
MLYRLSYPRNYTRHRQNFSFISTELKWADKTPEPNFECTQILCDLNCGFLLTYLRVRVQVSQPYRRTGKIHRHITFLCYIRVIHFLDSRLDDKSFSTE